ncbi:hypothetical protein C2S51_027022 [Perilla frutescens var. frutescens]|nr:hypothetical protein C2S51_027022 [Perilla frutescens var. frutescens]
MRLFRDDGMLRGSDYNWSELRHVSPLIPLCLLLTSSSELGETYWVLLQGRQPDRGTRVHAQGKLGQSLVQRQHALRALTCLSLRASITFLGNNNESGCMCCQSPLFLA